MKCSRMSMENQWKNVGRGAAKKELPIEAVLTGKPTIDALIQAGYDKGMRKYALEKKKAAEIKSRASNT